MMTFRFFPPVQAGPQNDAKVVVELPASVCGYAVLLLENVKYRPLWASDADFAAGVAAIEEMQKGMMQDMSTGITQAIDRLYVLLDQALNGNNRVAGVAPDGSPEYSPVIPFGGIPNLVDGIGTLPGLRRQMLNAQGLTDTGWFDGPARPATMADLLNAGQLKTAEEQGVIPDSIEDLVDLVVSGSGTVSDGVTDILSTFGGIASDGGLAAVNAALMGLLSTQIGAMSLAIGELVDQVQQINGLDPVGDVAATNSIRWLLQQAGNTAIQTQLNTATAANQLQQLNGAATVEPSTPAQNSVRRMLLDMRGIVQNNGATAVTTSINTAATAALLRQLLGLEAVSDPIVGASLLTLAQCICQNTGKIAANTEPDNPDQPGFPEPTANCVTAGTKGPRYRVESWQLIGQTGDGTGNVYAAVWPTAVYATLGCGQTLLTASSGTQVTGLVMFDGYSFEVCDSWNTAGFTQELWWARPNSTSAAGVEAALLAPFGSLPSDVSNEMEDNSFLVSTGPLVGSNYYIVHTAEVLEGGDPPPLDRWLSIAVTPNEGT